MYITMTKICFITAIYGGYEKTCKKFVEQSVPTDFICFTDNPNITHNGWKIDTTPYHIVNKSKLENPNYINSVYNNSHTFNVAKYYKQSFKEIPILQKYDVIVWLDGSVEITYDKTSEYLLSKIYDKKIIGWHHEWRYGDLSKEVEDSVRSFRYSSKGWNGQVQPFQDVTQQYKAYLDDGYTNDYFKQFESHTPHFGVWITCFVAFLQHDESVKKFLDLWYLQTLQYTTQDQIGFPYSCQKLNMLPFTLPNDEVSGDKPHIGTMFYHKHGHGV